MNADYKLRRDRYRRAADAINRFALDLYGRVTSPNENSFVSPISVHAALSLALNSAHGETANELAHVLHWSAEPTLDSASTIVMKAIFSEDDALKLVIANAIWAHEGLQINECFADKHATDLHRVDFANAADRARATINAWVARHTAGKIPAIIGPGGIDALTRFILTNAVYFRADWRKKFDPTDTNDHPFHCADGTTVSVPMMHQVEEAIEHDRFWAVNLWYESFRMHMQVFVPRKPDDLPWLEKRVLGRSPDGWQRAMHWRRVDLTLPRFQIKSTFELGHTLEEMGLKRAFDRTTADFSRLTDDAVWLSNVIHKTYVDVNEEGTEAAGATAAMLVGGCGGEYAPLVVKADRPFLFTICGSSDLDFRGQPMFFMGRVVNPRNR
jgi:serpin B